ncbi:hypothetical protein [Mucilaginibacter terrae]|uniref:Carbohydrate ABC transporter permease n=1 Tax=Mucilaginibacter terrae TaxID=1955052 RepID=A0ABU3GT63_9SPHI|nr:hypothetical protein [Mucilaginibacter terrae]MDT3402954.1 hypothetical protein [Mucilaginibacter terrae]
MMNERHKLICKVLAGLSTIGFVYLTAPIIFILNSGIWADDFASSITPGWHTTIYPSWIEKLYITAKNITISHSC